MACRKTCINHVDTESFSDSAIPKNTRHYTVQNWTIRKNADSIVIVASSGVIDGSFQLAVSHRCAVLACSLFTPAVQQMYACAARNLARYFHSVHKIQQLFF